MNGYLLHSHSKRNNKFKCNIWRGIALLLNCIDFNDSKDHQVLWVVFIFLCFFVFVLVLCFGFSFHSRNFHSYGDVTIAGEGLQILTYARHSWQLSSAWEFFCVPHLITATWGKPHPFIMVISEDQWHSHLLLSVWQRKCHYLFCRNLDSSTLASSNSMRHCRGGVFWSIMEFR